MGEETPVECSSPPCMLHEMDAVTGSPIAPSPLPAPDAASPCDDPKPASEPQ
jgi:hypothetical protein